MWCVYFVEWLDYCGDHLSLVMESTLLDDGLLNSRVECIEYAM